MFHLLLEFRTQYINQFFTKVFFLQIYRNNVIFKFLLSDYLKKSPPVRAGFFLV